MPGSGTVPSPRGLPPVAALHAALGVRRFSFSADHHAGTAEPFRVARPQAVVSNLNDQQMTNTQAPMTSEDAAPEALVIGHWSLVGHWGLVIGVPAAR